MNVAILKKEIFVSINLITGLLRIKELCLFLFFSKVHWENV